MNSWGHVTEQQDDWRLLNASSSSSLSGVRSDLITGATLFTLRCLPTLLSAEQHFWSRLKNAKKAVSGGVVGERIGWCGHMWEPLLWRSLNELLWCHERLCGTCSYFILSSPLFSSGMILMHSYAVWEVPKIESTLLSTGVSDELLLVACHLSHVFTYAFKTTN